MKNTRSRGLAATGVLGFTIAGLGVVAYAAPAAGQSTAARHPAAARPSPRCHTGDLTAGLRALDPSAGGRHAVLTLRNDSGHACRVGGHAGLQLYADDGAEVPTNAVWAGGRGEHFTLIPGASAFTRLDWGVVPAGDEPTTGTCEPGAARLAVTPPDEYTQRTTAWPYGPVCAHGTITTGPLAPGIGPVY